FEPFSVVSETPYQRFANVQMPRWYRRASWAVRLVGLLLLVGCAWLMTHEDARGPLWPIAGGIMGLLLLILPSLPKAYIEQRNRIRGLRDGSGDRREMNDQKPEVFSVSDGEAYCWLERESSVMLRAVTKHGDPVELTKQEAFDLAHALLKVA